MDLIPAAGIIGDALTAQRMMMDVVAENIANANTTKGPDGLPYQRKMLVFESILNEKTSGVSGAQSVRVTDTVSDKTPGEMIYRPGHPHADPDGFLHMPNVKISMEMVDLISASRSYEANLTLMKTSRQMANQALSIGR